MNMNIKKKITALIPSDSWISHIIKAIFGAGGRALLVGGAVRDLLLDRDVKDIDIEVHGLSIDALENILAQFGPIRKVGKVYGVLRIDGLDVDWSIPRSDQSGRKPKVDLDPHMSFEDAFARRDLTINAMGIDLHTYELIDPFDGYQDLCNGLLRAPDIKRFVEDPLRFYRVMQFISRFNMLPDDELNDVCRTMDVAGVSRERIEVEWEKMLLKSDNPSLGIRWLKSIGRLSLFPELAALVGVEQNPEWHPEGDVFEHTMQTLDAAAHITDISPDQRLLLLYAAVCHDMGKPLTTKIINGVIRSLGHEAAGVKPVKQFLKRITNNKDLIAGVIKLVKNHMIPTQLIKPEVTAAAYKRLANKLAPEVTIQLLAYLCLADKLGRNPDGPFPLTGMSKEIEDFLKRAQEIKVETQPEQPVLHGRDLMDVVKPGPRMGALLKKAYQIQIDEGITDKSELKRRVMR